MNIKEDTKVTWINANQGKYCACCGSVKDLEEHKANCIYFKLLKSIKK